MTKVLKTEKVVKKVKKMKIEKKTEVNSHVKKIIVTTPTVAEQKVHGGLVLDVFDTAGNVASSLSLPAHIFGVEVNPKLIAQAVRVYLVNQRQGTVSTKNRGEVDGSTRKIYRQKGTGRARHGGIRAPIFVKGGLAHGPKQKDYELSMPKKMRRAALVSALSAKAKDGTIRIVMGIESLEAKTKAFAGAFDKWGMIKKTRNTLLVLPNDMATIHRSVRNLTGITTTTVQRLNTYDVLKHKELIMTKETVDGIEKAFARKEEK